MAIRRLVIDELVLHGSRAADAVAIAAGLERELRARLAAGGVDPRSASSLRCEGTAAAVGTQPREVGAQIAAAVHRGLQR